MKLEGKYKEFKYKINETGYQIFHKHYTACSGTLDMPFKRIDLKNPNSKDLKWMRNKIYKDCENSLKNPWWRGLDKYKKEKIIIEEQDNIFPLVEITWRDITHLSRAKDIEMVKDMKLMTFSTLGYLILEDEEKISLAGSLLHQNSEVYTSDDYYREVLIIPKTNITNITKLKTHKN